MSLLIPAIAMPLLSTGVPMAGLMCRLVAETNCGLPETEFVSLPVVDFHRAKVVRSVAGSTTGPCTKLPILEKAELAPLAKRSLLLEVMLLNGGREARPIA